ncbi:MAG: ATP-binding protein [Thermomicrobiales bacterium]
MADRRLISTVAWRREREQESSPPLATFGDLLRRLRIAAGLTQEELAARATLSARAISEIECGRKQRPQRETIRLLADVLGLSDDARVLFEATARRPPAAASQPVLAAHVPHNLPAPVTPVVGREDDLAAVAALLCRVDVRLVTITGLGGIGKTRLGLEIAAHLLAGFPDGVFFVPLAAARDPAFVIAAIARTLGVKEGPGQEMRESLVAALRGKRRLLVLDNFEHLLPAADGVADLLAACPRLKVLVTSRAPLHLHGEHEWSVDPLPLPAARDAADARAIARSPAVELFRQRAVAVKRDFRLTTENAGAVAAICVKLDGVPLAIELAAARIRSLSPTTLLTRLEHRLAILTGGARNLPARQQTLRGAIDWSYDLLTPDEQRLFRRLGVFVGGWTMEAAEAVGGEGDIGVTVLDCLESLIGKSLVRQVEAVGDTPRFTMLETVREYGLERLATSGETAAVQRAHATYFLSLAETVEPKLFGPDQTAALAQLEAEHDNLRAVLRWVREHHEAAMGLRLATALWRFWQGHGHFSEGREWLEGLLALDHHADDRSMPSVRARALIGAAMLAFRQNDYERTAALSEESLALCRATGDRVGIGEALNVRGLAADNLGDAPHAASLYAESLALHRQLGSAWKISVSLINLGILARAQGEYTRARALMEEGLILRRNLGDTWGIAHALRILGLIAQEQGDYAGAAPLHEESLLLCKTLGDRQGIAFALANLGHIAGVQGDNLRATLLFEESLALSRALGDRRTTSRALSGFGDIARQHGDVTRAIALYKESLTLNRNVGHLLGVAENIERFALIAYDQGQPERAARLLGAANALRTIIGAPLPPADRDAYDRTITNARTALGEKAFASAWEAGRMFSMEQVVAEALGETAVSAAPQLHPA